MNRIQVINFIAGMTVFAWGFAAGGVFLNFRRKRQSRARRGRLEARFQRDVAAFRKRESEFGAIDPALGITYEDVRQAMEDVRQ